jgi:ABC-type sugar transport system permease subunit
MMEVLNKLDTFMPWLASAHGTVVLRDHIVTSIFGGVWGLIVFATLLLSVQKGLAGLLKAWFWWAMMAAIAFGYWYGGEKGAKDPHTTLGLVRFAIGMAIPLAFSAMAYNRSRERWLTVARWLGAVLLVIAAGLLIGTMIWTTPVHQFARPAPGVGAAPSWLGNSQLVIPSIILWGFPWIGTVGVLIYLAGLQAIDESVYEAAQLDGVSSIGKLFKIELPLIMTQVRINLIFMTIGTLGDYGLLLLLLGPDGGPGNKGMVPGLYTYRTAFVDQRYGYACALGMVMFFIILFITILYQKYVKVDK